MENKLNDKQNTNSIVAAHHKKEMVFPLIAVGLSLSIIPLFLCTLMWELPSFVILFMVMLPIAGFITGIASLCRGKKRIDKVGMILSITAIALPVSIVLLIIIFFIGAATGLISLM